VPEFAGRSCHDCQTYVYGENGVRSENEDTGEPFLRSDYGDLPTPCGSCPKLGPNDPQEPLPTSRDLYAQPWFWDLRQLAREWRAMRDVPEFDSFTKSLAVEFLLSLDREAEVRQSDRLAGVIATAFGRR
jgi:hypothetical protein